MVGGCVQQWREGGQVIGSNCNKCVWDAVIYYWHACDSWEVGSFPNLSLAIDGAVRGPVEASRGEMHSGTWLNGCS